MSSLIELVEQVNRGDEIAAETLQAAQDSPNAAERFLAHHAGATLGLRKCHRHLLEALRAIDFADRKVLDQFVGLCGFLDCVEDATAPTIAFGRSSIERGELALGLEAISSAVALDIARGGLWGRRRDNAQNLAALYSEAAARIGWAGGGERSNNIPHVAYVTSSLGDDEPAARSAAAFAHAIGSREFKLGIYSTEGYVARDKQQWTHLVNEGDGALPTARRGRATIQRIESSPASHWIAPTSGGGGDVIGAAKALAQQISDDQADLIFIDADPSDPVASLLASWPVAERCVWIARRSPLFSEQIDGICYFDPAAAEIDRGWWATRDITSTSTIEGVDLSAPVGEGPRRGQYGIPGAAVIAATSVEDVPRQVGMKMVEQVISLLKANAQLVFLLIGSGDTSVHRRKFELAGVGRRVGYAGQRRDLPAFLKMADLYLCPFAAEAPSAMGTLTAMSAGLPVLAMIESSGTSGASVPCELVGSEATASSGANWIEIGTKLSREAGFRRKLGAVMRKRVEHEFAYDQTADTLVEIIERELDLTIGRSGGEDVAIEPRKAA